MNQLGVTHQKLSKTPINIKSKNITFDQNSIEDPRCSKFQEDFDKVKNGESPEDVLDDNEISKPNDDDDPPINYKFYNIDGAPTQKNQA